MRRPASPEPGVEEHLKVIGQSPGIRTLLARVRRVAPTEATVLIRGERGTGKELVAAALVAASRRAGRPHIRINCAALPSELLASELFGHERGAFTGAVERRSGLLRSAQGGTVFLDEVGDLSTQGQAMLLRVLQEREVRAVGAAEATRVDVRVLAATNKELERAVERGEFRADLLDRLAEIVLWVPPLRTRPEDIPLLAAHFVAVHAQRHGVSVRGLAPSAHRALACHGWPGNVRELEQAISRGVIAADGGWIEADHLELPGTEDAPGGLPPLECLHLTTLPPRQCLALRLAITRGVVGRSDLTRRFAISGEAARQDLVALAAAGLLQRAGRGRGSRYVPTHGRPCSPTPPPTGMVPAAYGACAPSLPITSHVKGVRS